MIEAHQEHPNKDGELKLSDKQFTQILHKHRKYVTNVVFHKTRAIYHHEVQDVVQDVQLKAWINRHRFNYTTPSSFRTWISKITHNILIDRLRKLDGKENRPQGGLLSMDKTFMEDDNENNLYSLIVDSSQHLDKTLDENELLSDINEYISLETHRDKRHLHTFKQDIQGFSYKETSIDMGLPRETIKSYVYQFRKKIKTKFGHRWSELYQ